MRWHRAPALALAATAGAVVWASPIDAEPAVPRPTESRWAEGRGVAPIVRKPRAEDAADEGSIETIGTIYNLHTEEMVPLSEDEPSVDAFSGLLEDRGLASRAEIDPRLLEVRRAFARAHPGARIDIVSGYRSAKRNEMMRKKGHHVASHSQHSLGQAVDFRVEGLTVAKMARELEDRGWKGGLGRYPYGSDLFIHADVGPNRRWLGR